MTITGTARGIWGMAYLKHPVGIEFINFFGENMMRADIGVATAEMGII